MALPPQPPSSSLFPDYNIDVDLENIKRVFEAGDLESFEEWLKEHSIESLVQELVPLVV